MFFPTFSGSESGPYQPKLPLSNWSNTGADSGSYTINLTGAHFATTTSAPGLTVHPGRTLALVGGEVSLDGVILQAPGGRLELGGVRNSGTVGLNFEGNNLRLSFPKDVARADVSLINGAELNVVAGHGGSIAINARNLDLEGRSQILAGIGLGQGSVGSQAGDIILNATGTIRMTQASQIENAVNSNAIGNGGNILVTTGSLFVTDYHTQFKASTGGQGNAGNIIIRSDSFILSGIAPFPVLQDGSPGGFSSGLMTSTNEGASGQGGNISVTAANLHILDGGVLSARSQSDFKAGNITINANALEVTGGGQILSTAFSNGDAGNITVDVTDRTTISGSDPTFFDRFNQVAQVFGEPQAMYTIDPVSPESGLFANTVSGSTGKGGSISINSNQVAISNGAKVAVDSQGQGNGGNITIQANSLTLNDKASIVAQTASDEGGNLTLQVNDILLMRHNSLISAEAGGTGNGGNIDIDADFVVAVPKEDSDIVANAYQGKGGNINITTQGIYGLEFRPHLTPLSDITASSQFGINGVVQINTPGVDPSRGLAKLPTDVVHAEGLIDRHCTPTRGTDQRSSFTVTGRGGLPPSPNDPLRGETVITNWVTLDSENENRDRTTSPPNPTTTTPNQLVEAQGWIIGADGQVILTAQAPTVTPQTTELKSPSCQDFQTDTP